MKSFNDILNTLSGLFHSGEDISKLGGVPTHSLGSSKRHNKNRKPNPFRKAHKPVYGGWPHTLEMLRRVPALTQDQLRRLEAKLEKKLMVSWQGIHAIKRIVKLNRNGKPMGYKRMPGKVLMTTEEAFTYLAEGE